MPDAQQPSHFSEMRVIGQLDNKRLQFRLASEAGATGQVLAVDVNPDQLTVAKWN